ncbi:MAG TPA: response regulator [Phycisphaerales bacterium]|nr:response regulator [Phycisphaerales bacterium]
MACILIVEDDESMNKILVETLEDEEHQVTAAFNGQEALELAKRTSFDLIITDVRLPGMDGIEVVEALKKTESGPLLKSIVITGYASADTPVRAMRMQVDDYLFKPFSLKYLLKSVERVLAKEEEGGVRSRVSKLFSQFGRRFKDKKLAQLVTRREEVFCALFVGVRSKYLEHRAAYEIYAKLEVLERYFRGLLNKESPEDAKIRHVLHLYSEVGRRLESLENEKIEEPEGEGAVPVEQFTALYDAIQNDEIGLQELLYAPLLRITPDSRFETQKELLELKKRMWPNLASSK